MSELKTLMYKAMEDTRWWEVGNEAIEDITNDAMKVVSQYTDEIDNILLSGLDPEKKIASIIYLQNQMIKD